MKLNQWLFSLSSFFLCLSGCKGNMNTMTKFDWLATESAPQNYPMEIVSAYLVAEDGSAVYVPNGAYINHGWGEMGSAHVVGPDLKSLPSHLDIAFFSYTEDTFYQGNFDLPYERILSLFQQGYHTPTREEKLRYRRIMVGIAPGGVVSVWLMGPAQITEVFYGHAAKVDIPWETFKENNSLARQQYRSIVFQDAFGEAGIARLKEEGVPFGLWDSYRIEYLWRLRVHSERAVLMPSYVDYFTGSKDYQDFSLPENESWTKKLPIPKSIYFRWPREALKVRKIELYFDEQEIMQAFDLLVGQHTPYAGQLAYLEVYIQEKDKKRTIVVGLRRGDEFIGFKKIKVKAFFTESKK